jgi:hypothetical protein
MINMAFLEAAKSDVLSQSFEENDRLQAFGLERGAS